MVHNSCNSGKWPHYNKAFFSALEDLFSASLLTFMSGSALLSFRPAMLWCWANWEKVCRVHHTVAAWVESRAKSPKKVERSLKKKSRKVEKSPKKYYFKTLFDGDSTHSVCLVTYVPLFSFKMGHTCHIRQGARKALQRKARSALQRSSC
jgi:hypothetical protein